MNREDYLRLKYGWSADDIEVIRPASVEGPATRGATYGSVAVVDDPWLWERAQQVLLRFNPHHDKSGRFGSGGGGGPVGYRPGGDIAGSTDFDSLGKLHDPASGEDRALVEIRERQGFNGHPQVVSRKEFDEAVSSGGVTETWRGINGTKASEYAEAYRTGDHYPGSGVYGNGTYVANHRAEAELSAGRFEPGSDAGALLRIGLRSDAKVISIDKLRTEMRTYNRRNAGLKARLDELDQQMIRTAERATTTEGRIAIYAEFNARKAKAGAEYLVSQDPGRFAALRGYDAVDIPKGQGGAQMIILNRTAVIVEQG